MVLEWFVVPHRGVCTNHSAVFSHVVPNVRLKIQNLSLNGESKLEA